MTAFKIMVVKTKFIVAKYDYRPLISSPARQPFEGRRQANSESQRIKRLTISPKLVCDQILPQLNIFLLSRQVLTGSNFPTS